MEYKNYLAEVEVDESVGLLHGRVVNSGPYPIATFEAKNVAGLRKEFELSVDEYLLSCEEDGVEPRKPFSGKLNVRLGPTLHQQVAAAASTEGVSLNSWIVRALEARSAAIRRFVEAEAETPDPLEGEVFRAEPLP